MAKKPKITIIKSNKVLSPAQTALLASDDWKQIQSLLAIDGPTRERLAQVAPLMWRVLRMRERLLSELDQLPMDIRDKLCLILTERTFKQPGPPRTFDHTDVALFMQTRISEAKAKGKRFTVTGAAMEAQAKFDCRSSSAEKWYYTWRKKNSS